MIKGAARSAFLLIRCGLGMPPAQHHEREGSKQSGKNMSSQHRIALMPHQQQLSQIGSRHAAKTSMFHLRKREKKATWAHNNKQAGPCRGTLFQRWRKSRNQKQTPPWHPPPSTSSRDPTKFTPSCNFIPLILPPPTVKRQELSHVSGWLHPPEARLRHLCSDITMRHQARPRRGDSSSREKHCMTFKGYGNPVADMLVLPMWHYGLEKKGQSCLPL